MSLISFMAVGGGAALGAWLRWGLGLALNPLLPMLPLGTLAANLLGGLLIGVAVEIFNHHHVSPEVRLAITTGFLGGFTTFSAFSGEMVHLLAEREYLWAAIGIAVHVIGSLALTAAGIALVRLAARV